MQRYRIEVGHADQVKPGSLVGAIANEAGLDGQHIGRITIYDDYSTVDLPEGMPRELMNILKRTRVAGKPLRISVDGAPRSRKPQRGPSDKPSTPKAKAKATPKSKVKPKPKAKPKSKPTPVGRQGD